MKTFDQLTHEDLKTLRNDVVMGSIYYADYQNSFHFNVYDVSNFFDGYESYIRELMEEDNADDSQFDQYENLNNLIGWYNCYDDFSWVRFDEKIESIITTIKANISGKSKPFILDEDGIVLDSCIEDDNITIYSIFKKANVLYCNSNYGELKLIECINDMDDWFTLEDIILDLTH
jgi:hypothetical protein